MKKLLVFIAGLIIIVSLPIIIWFSTDQTELDVSIIDYTVPDEKYREHHSLTWLLNHNHYQKTDGTEFNEENDYIGLKTDEQAESVDNYRFPSSLTGKDLIYIADTYGVYESDLPWSADVEATPGSSDLIEGGLMQEDWNLIKNQVLSEDTDLVMEFNSFASPTADNVKQDVMEFIKADWTGWIGRYFPSLEGEEVPAWMIDQYENAQGDWQYEGEGFILLNESSDSILVLDHNDFDDTAIRLNFTEKGKELFDLEDSPGYRYWFDILLPQDEEDVAAWYDWSPNTSGSGKLKDAGIPDQFPAVLHHTKRQANITYFAGDYADVESLPSYFQVSGMATVQRWLSPETFSPDKSFFWRTAAPLIEKTFNLAAEKSNATADQSSARESQASINDISYPARINEQQYEVYRDSEWQPITIKGVNMGMGKPGYFPGEAAITREEYDRWFKMIGEMNANTVRVYTLHPPAFYDALAAYNEQAQEPIYLMHGVWADEEPLEETLDAFNEESTEAFREEIQHITDAIHGNANIDHVTGHASGVYRSDVSQYVIGWMIGIEWYPIMVDQMKSQYPDMEDFSGDYISTDNADPMEIWLAEQFEYLVNYELEEYQSMRPLSFTNWVTTDNLEHPAEPSEQEDLATVDPNHISVSGDVEEVGMFASYHVYPYYPDFLNLEEKYTEFIDHRGEPNNYAGYLADLKASHDLPILIAEFGIPASRGKTHENPFGWNQGFIEETEQGEILSRLYEDMIHLDMLGGLVFTWQDEWFKRTWNTMDYDNPDRRPYWSNAQTNEQQFGLLSFDRHLGRINGKEDEEAQSLGQYSGQIKELKGLHDERYLYLQLDVPELSEAFFDDQWLDLYFSIRPDKGIETGEGPADFRARFKGKEADLEVAGDYDTFYFDYATTLDMIPANEEPDEFHPIRLALNKAFVRPDTNELIPFESYETGALKYGIGDPDHEEYDSLADYYYTEDGLIEIRIPWMMLNAKDPSQREFTGDIQQDGLTSSIEIDAINISAAIMSRNDQKVIEQTPFESYKWEKWDIPQSEERLKDSYYILQELFNSSE